MCKKLISGLIAVGILIPVAVSAQSIGDLQSQLQSLLSRVQVLQTQLRTLQEGQAQTGQFPGGITQSVSATGLIQTGQSADQTAANERTQSLNGLLRGLNGSAANSFVPQTIVSAEDAERAAAQERVNSLNDLLRTLNGSAANSFVPQTIVSAEDTERAAAQERTNTLNELLRTLNGSATNSIVPQASVNTGNVGNTSTQGRVNVLDELLRHFESPAQGVSDTGVSSVRNSAGILLPGVVEEKALPRICRALSVQAYRMGSQGEEVKDIQEFLVEEGLLDSEITGYFGRLTELALGKWQMANGVASDASNGLGIFGPRTREVIKKWCSRSGSTDGGSESDGKLRAAPLRGSAPLTVKFSANVSVADPSIVADAGYYKIVFGDGNEQQIVCAKKAVDGVIGGDGGFCRGPHTVEHTYTADGTYTAEIVHYGYFGISEDGNPPMNSVGTVTIRVGGQVTACTLEYAPVCGEKQVQCVTTPCNPVQQTYSNRCMLNADGATFVHQGSCDQVAGETPNTASGTASTFVCGDESKPVCGVPAFNSIDFSCFASGNGCSESERARSFQQTYSTKCELRDAGAILLYSGACRGELSAPSTGRSSF